MFINETFITIFFKLLNLFALLGLALLVFRKFIRSDLISDIERKETEKENLQAQQLTLEKKQQELDALLKEEAIQCQHFRAKIDTWKKVVVLEQDVREKKYNDIVLTMKKRATDIALHKEDQRVQSIVIDMAVQDLEKSLSLIFKDHKKNSDYLDAIVQFMKGKTS